MLGQSSKLTTPIAEFCAAVFLNSKYHFPFEGAIVLTAVKVPDVLTPSTFPSDKVALLELKGFKVAKLFCGVSVVISIAAKLVGVK